MTEIDMNRLHISSPFSSPFTLPLPRPEILALLLEISSLFPFFAYSSFASHLVAVSPFLFVLVYLSGSSIQA